MPLSTWSFALDSEWAGRILILAPSGRLTRRSVAQLRDELAEGERAGAGILVDLARLDYISGAGLAVLQEVAERAVSGGRAFVLCGVEGSVRIALDLAGLLDVLTVETTRERAMARMAGPPG